ncbi:MAG TPA: DUF362 domain-containing protein [Anaerolineae bacterium]|nr:DUF362 domain-containing protein [Anaerolineae bacterium]
MSSASERRFSRREFLKLAATAAGGALLGGGVLRGINQFKQPAAATVILKATSYEQDLYDLLRRGLAHFPVLLRRCAGARVILKPNLVEYHPGRQVNTHPALIAAAVEALRYYGAGEVIVAEGPGHQRDMELLLTYSGLEAALGQVHVPFVDLNLDDIAAVPLTANYTQLGQLYLPKTILNADLVISLPKLKTHKWAGVTLSLKNLFGVAPGVKYGWPKNLLHWRGIDNSIWDIALAVKPAFAIVDGIEGMEGDGPIYGETVQAGVLVMGGNLTAVDATAARVMGIYPEHISHLMGMRRHGGTVEATRIQQLGEPISVVQQDFAVLPYWAPIKRPPPWIHRLFLVG